MDVFILNIILLLDVRVRASKTSASFLKWFDCCGEHADMPAEAHAPQFYIQDETHICEVATTYNQFAA